MCDHTIYTFFCAVRTVDVGDFVLKKIQCYDNSYCKVSEVSTLFVRCWSEVVLWSAVFWSVMGICDLLYY